MNHAATRPAPRRALPGALAAAWLALALVLAPPAPARWLQGGESADERSWQKSVEGFGAMLVVTDDEADFLRSWEQPGERAPLPVADVIALGETFTAFVIFTGCEPDHRGACDATVDFEVLRPDGSEYARFVDGELWRDKPPPPYETLELGIDYVGVATDRSEPGGTWRVRALVRDRIATLLLELVRDVEVRATR